MDEIAELMGADQKVTLQIMGDLIVGEKNKYRDIKVEAQNSSIGDNNEVHQINIQTNTEIKEALKNIEQEISKLKDIEEKVMRKYIFNL
ncbi:hypothetical protein [Sporosarcina ureae]|uniref:Uncharacterized protein n=1 Tax=Sporosarcina ureae TaxID=1571 RepID=A0ABM6JYH4_SPOUR|nr:hypothetical protein [Sporosarcina ureae]ARF15084.1 hypothetical protein SporoS204_13545 [Sporosarcina ureae]